MAIDRKFVGKTYGPYSYQACLEKMREFAYAVSGGVPSSAFGGGPPEGLHPYLHDPEAARHGPHGSVIAFPTFAVTFAIAPFAACVTDPALGIDLVKLVHGEQELELLDVIRPGDVLTTTGKITEIFHKAGLDFLTVTTESTDASGKPVVRATWTAVIRP